MSKRFAMPSIDEVYNAKKKPSTDVFKNRNKTSPAKNSTTTTTTMTTSSSLNNNNNNNNVNNKTSPFKKNVSPFQSSATITPRDPDAPLRLAPIPNASPSPSPQRTSNSGFSNPSKNASNNSFSKSSPQGNVQSASSNSTLSVLNERIKKVTTSAQPSSASIRMANLQRQREKERAMGTTSFQRLPTMQMSVAKPTSVPSSSTTVTTSSSSSSTRQPLSQPQTLRPSVQLLTQQPQTPTVQKTREEIDAEIVQENTKRATNSDNLVPTYQGNSNAIIVNIRQKGNPLLKHIRNVTWEYGNIIPDYVVGQSACVLFLSLVYHGLHKDYIYQRVRELGRQYRLRVLLCYVDTKQHQTPLNDIGKLAALNGFTLILAWSPEEAARYIETYKSYENKPVDSLMERLDTTYMAKSSNFLTAIKSINKTDVMTLLSIFGTLDNVIHAKKTDIARCPGFGDSKVKRLREAFEEPFLMRNSESEKEQERTGQEGKEKEMEMEKGKETETEKEKEKETEKEKEKEKGQEQQQEKEQERPKEKVILID